MANDLFFSRDTKLVVSDGTVLWEIPVLDGFSFSQATNSSEVTLNEMEGSDGVSRRGRRMFNDSVAPAEWSFSTYARPFASTNGVDYGWEGSGSDNQQHAVEEVLWAALTGKPTFTKSASTTESAWSGDTSSVTGRAAALTAASNHILPANIAINKCGSADYSTAAMATTSDGNGTGAKVVLAYDATNGAGSPEAVFSATLVANSGSGYDAADKLFVSKEVMFSALQAAFADQGIAGAFTAVLSDLTLDLEVNIATVNTGTVANGVNSSTTSLIIDFLGSNASTVKELDFYFVMGSGTWDDDTHQAYKLTDAVVNSATMDFDIDGIATIQWSGFAKTITDHVTEADFTLTTTNGIKEAIDDTDNYIRNRLTTLAVTTSGAAQGSILAEYSLTLTGGSISFENNISYLTPETIGSVNSPIGHVTGNRTIGGSFTCYLSNATNSSSDLFEDLATSTSVVTNKVALEFDIGGSSSPTIKVALPACHLEIPAHSIEDVISLETTFSALPTSITASDEATITYKGV